MTVDEFADKLERLPIVPKTLAIISGRGGSGKTLIATSLSEALAISGQNVLLIDTDMGTGGLTHYLGFNGQLYT